MDMTRRVLKQTAMVTVPLVILSLFPDWNRESLRFLRPFGNPDYMTISIILGTILGIANLRAMIWGLESMLGTQQASAKLVFLSLLRLFILFTIIIVLAALRLINFLGLLTGMTVVFFFLIKEGLKMAQKQ
jgi:hypothetical protein